jgi:hypothetical protein
MTRRARGVDRDLDRACGKEPVLTTAQLSWALRIGEQQIRIAAKSISPAPKKLGHVYGWSRDDACRLLAHLSLRRRDTSGSDVPPPRDAA